MLSAAHCAKVLLRLALVDVCCLASLFTERSELWGSGFELSLVVALTIFAIVICANTIGALIPLVAQRFKIDPALVSAPLITTLVDATGLVIYMFIAKSILSSLR